MSYTNKTPNYDLPQYVANDKPTFLSDINGAFSDIDTAMKANATAAASAQSTADANTSAISGITTDLDGAGGVKARLSAVETAQQGDAGNINTINSLIGNGTPTTTDHTIIGAINEIHEFTGKGPLDTTAKNLADAINELAAGGNVGALDDLSDVEITTPANGDALVYDATNQKWVNQAGGTGLVVEDITSDCTFESMVTASKVVRYGNIVEVFLKVNTVPGSYTKCAQLPAGYTPQQNELPGTIITTTTGGTSHFPITSIQSSGGIYYQNDDGQAFSGNATIHHIFVANISV